MTRLATIVGLLIAGLLLPLNVAAFWLPDSQCSTESVLPETAVASLSDLPDATDCDRVLDPTDSSYNACFELAEHPISTLPELIAQTQAERIVAAMLAKSQDVTAVTILIPSPNEASIEDPESPGRQLVENAIPRPRPRPNACSVYPDDCENAPAIPTLNLDGSVPQADTPSANLDVPPAITPQSRRGPPSSGVGPAIGVSVRLDRPPQVG